MEESYSLWFGRSRGLEAFITVRQKTVHPVKGCMPFVYCRYYFISSLLLHYWSRTNKMYSFTYKIWILFSHIFMLLPVITSSMCFFLFCFVNQSCYSSALFIKKKASSIPCHLGFHPFRYITHFLKYTKSVLDR